MMKLFSALLLLFSILSQLDGFYLFDSSSLGDAYIFVDAIDAVPQYAENLMIKSYIVEDEYDDTIQSSQIINGGSAAKKQNQQQPNNIAQLEEQLQKEEKLIVDAYFAKMAKQKAEQQTKQQEVQNATEVHHKVNPFDKNDKVNPFQNLDKLDNRTIYIEFEEMESQEKVQDLIDYISYITYVPRESIQLIKNWKNIALIGVTDDQVDMSNFIDTILKYTYDIELKKNMKISSCDLALKSEIFRVAKSSVFSNENALIIAIIVFVPILLAIILALALCIMKKRRQRHDDEEVLVKDEDDKQKSKRRFHPYNWVIPILKKSRIGLKRDVSPSQEYKDLCRQRMESPINSTLSTTMSNINTPGKVINSSTINSTPIRITNDAKNMNENDRNSSWVEDSPKNVNIDITTGHVILDYIEKHFNDKNLLNREWNNLSTYEAEPNKMDVGASEENKSKNRYQDVLPYDHSRVVLKTNGKNDYINASYITDDDPKNPMFIATQSPLDDTCEDFWSMIWENDSLVIVALCSKEEYESAACRKYWPENSCEVYGKFEIHLVSIHIWSDDYLIRNFLVKNTSNNQTRAVTQFHFMEWPSIGIPSSVKALLEFRRKVKKSQSNNSRPVVVHCNDGVGRTGAYILIDMVVNKIVKGAKEIDLSATLEYLRDQRPDMVKFKYLYEYAFEAVTEELKNMLNF